MDSILEALKEKYASLVHRLGHNEIEQLEKFVVDLIHHHTQPAVVAPTTPASPATGTKEAK